VKKFKGCLGVFLIFFLGFVIGAIIASGSIYAKVWELIEGGPEKVAEFTVQRLNDELKLDDVQKREFKRIADRTSLKLRAIRYSSQPAVDAVLKDSDAEVLGILNPRQKKKFEEIMKRFRERWRAEMLPEQAVESATPVPATTPAPEPPPQ
jgi:hypothetical protein